MKFKLLIAITILALNSADGGAYPPPPQQKAQAGLNFAASVQQAKDQIKYFFAGEKPIHASIDKLEDYYADVKEKDMRKFHPRRKLRKPCKVLPDPQPGLVNPKLVAPVHRFKPLRRDEQFYGRFAPPMSYKMRSLNEANANEMVVGSLPPMRRSYPGVDRAVGPYPPAYVAGPAGPYPPVVAGPLGPNLPGAGPVPVPYPVIQKETVYAPNPFFGYTGDYKADGDYFQKNIRSEILETSDPYHRSRYLLTATVTATARPTSWKSQLSSDYSERISSMSADASSAASKMSKSYSLKMESIMSKYSKKEASLRSKLSSKSAAKTATWRRRDDDWHW